MNGSVPSGTLRKTPGFPEDQDKGPEMYLSFEGICLDIQGSF
jgi:hypothetical protein